MCWIHARCAITCTTCGRNSKGGWSRRDAAWCTKAASFLERTPWLIRSWHGQSVSLPRIHWRFQLSVIQKLGFSQGRLDIPFLVYILEYSTTHSVCAILMLILVCSCNCYSWQNLFLSWLIGTCKTWMEYGCFFWISPSSWTYSLDVWFGILMFYVKCELCQVSRTNTS